MYIPVIGLTFKSTKALAPLNKIGTFFRKKELYYGVARYSLGLTMMGYGLFKIEGLQCKLIVPFSAWQQPLEQLSGSHITWAFLGYSYWFQVLLGFFEFVPAGMLLWRRTAFAGSILILPMTVSVFLINHALHLWPYTKMLSLGLLALNIGLLLFEWRRLKEILAIVLNKAGKLSYSMAEVAINILVIGFVIYYTYYHSMYDRNERNALMGDWYNRHQNEFTLLSEKINDSTLPHHTLKAYFGPKGIYSEINDSVNNGDGFIFYSLDEKKRVVSFHKVRYTDNEGNYYNLQGDMEYVVLNDSLLQLQQTRSDGKHVWIFKKRVMNMRKGE